MLILPIKSRRDFVDIQKNSEKIFHTPRLILLQKTTSEKYTKTNEKQRAEKFVRLGITVTKKIDKRAVARNKIRRRLTEAFSKIDPEILENHVDYRVIARKRIIDCDFEDIVNDIKNCLLEKAKVGFPKFVSKNK